MSENVYLINADTMKVIGRFADIEAAADAGEKSGINFDTIADEADLKSRRWTMPKLADLWKSIGGNPDTAHRNKAGAAADIWAMLETRTTEELEQLSEKRRGRKKADRTERLRRVFETQPTRKDFIDAALAEGLKPNTAQQYWWRFNNGKI